MYSLSRRKKHKRWLFFLLFAGILIGMSTALALIMGHISSAPDPESIRLHRPEKSSTPMLAFASTGLILNLYIPPHDSDSWVLENNTLELRLHSANTLSATLATEGWLDQKIHYELVDGLFLVTIEVDNLPPVFRVAKRDGYYSVLWSDVGLGGKRIAIDPGHGGQDPGAQGKFLLEKDVTLAIALELQQMLLEAGAEIFMTRSTDTLVDTTLESGKHIRPDLWKRQAIVEAWDPDFFLSIHNNAWTDRNTGGIETYYNRQSFNVILNRQAAQLVQDRLVEVIGRKDRRIKYKETSDAVLQTVNYPSALAEILYITNPTEEQILAEPGFARRAAQGLFLGISDYFSGGVGR